MPLAQERVATTDTKGTRTERIEAVVICSDDSLLIELGPVLGDRYRIHTLDSPADLGQVRATRWIGVVDVDCLPEARAAVSRLELHHHHCPLILVAARPEDWAAAVARGAVLAAIGRDQVATARLSEALMAAEAHLRSASAEPEPHGGLPTARALRSSVAGAPPRAQRWIGTVALLVVIALTWSWLHHRHAVAVRPAPANASSAVERSGSVGSAAGVAASSPSSASPGASGPDNGAAPAADTTGATANAGADASTTQQQSVLELLSAARVAFRDQKLLLPRAEGELRGDSALELYVQVLSQDPQNDEALDGVRRLFALGRDRIAADVMGGKLDDATRLLGLLKAPGIDPGELQPLADSISAARPKWLAQRASQAIAAGDFKTGNQLLEQLTAAGTDPATLNTLRDQVADKKLELQLTEMAAQVHSAVQSGALWVPAADNARTRLAAMRALARTHPLTMQAQHELQAALVAAGEQATLSAQFDLAQRNLNAAAELGNFAPLSDAKRHLQTAMAAAAHTVAAATAAAQQAEQAREAADRARTATASAPLAARAPKNPGYIAAHPTRSLPLHFPDNASVSGYVVVEFTLAANGTASNASVVQANPPGVFNSAALDAVQHGRYSTSDLVNGQPARARILLRFNVQ